jgi:hypothetical protein
VTAKDQQAKELSAHGTRADKVDDQRDARARCARGEDGALRLPVSAALALAARSESFGERGPVLPNVTATNRELTSRAALTDFNLAFTRAANHLVVVSARQVLLGGRQADTVVTDLGTALPSVDLGLISALALGVVVRVIFGCAQGASESGAPLEEVLARGLGAFNATVSRLRVANTSLIVAKEVDGRGTREGRARIVVTSAAESTVSVTHDERVARTAVHRLAEANHVTQIDAVAVVGELTGEGRNRVAHTVEAGVVRVLLGADVQEVHVVVTRVVDRTVHVSVRLSQGVQVVVVSANAERAVGVTLAGAALRSRAITASRALGGSRTLSESVGRARGTLSEWTLLSVGVTTGTAVNADRLISGSVSTAHAIFAAFSTTLAFDDVAHTNRVNADLIVAGLQVVVVLLEVER